MTFRPWQLLNIGRLAWLTILLALIAPRAFAEEPSPAPVPPLSPLNASIQALLKEGVQPKLKWGQFPDFQAPLDQLYQGSGYAPLWTVNGTPISQATQVIASLAEADRNGLNSVDYDAELLHHWLGEITSKPKATPQNLASFDVSLSLSLMRYASNLYVGRVNPRHVNFGLSIEPKKLDLPALLKKIAHSPNPAEQIAGLQPKLKLYEQLKTALARYQESAKENHTAEFVFPGKFKPGDRHAQIPALRHFLTVLGDLPAETHSSQVYDKDLAEGVKRFQRRHGLGADGVIGKTTLSQLNYPLRDRVEQIQLGLERLRWLPDHIDGRYLIVNIPSFQLFGFENSDNKPAIEMNVIVGEAINERNTPVFHADMTYLTFRPYWNVPYKITAKEYFPQITRNPGYLAKNNLEIVTNFAPNSAVYEPSSENIQMLSTGALKLRQKPGPKNALGLVKFSFPNTNNVYLHSTPKQELFKKARRDFSHGCIRVEFPVKLAEYVLKEHSEWPKERIEETMQGDKTKTVTLKTPLPVYIFYSTVLANETDQVMFYDDIYGHDLILQNQLAKGFPYPP